MNDHTQNHPGLECPPPEPAAQPHPPGDNCDPFPSSTLPDPYKPQDCPKPPCWCPEPPGKPENCLEDLIKEQTKEITRADKAKAFKADLEILLTKAKAASQE